MDKVNDDAESTTKNSHRTYFPPSRNIHRRFEARLITMAIATEPLTPSHHLPLESTGLTPAFGGTPGFFSAEFSNVNPFDVDFHDAIASPLRVEQPLGTPHSHYSPLSHDIPRSIADVALRRNYDPSLVPTPGPRVSSMTPFKSSMLKESSTDPETSSSRLLPSPQRSPNALNPAFLEKSNDDYPPSYTLSPPAHTGYGSSRGVHGEVTPPNDESRSPENKDSKSKSQNKKSTSTRKRKSETEIEIKSEQDGSIQNSDEITNVRGGSSDNRRKKFLERNRLAAFKCRQKKKEWASNLEEQARYQAQENKLLRASVAQLRDECLYLKNFLLSTHAGCSCAGIKNYLMKEAQLNQQVMGMGGVMPITSLVHPGMDMGRGYPPMMGMHHPMDDRRRSESIGSGITISDVPPQQGSTSPQQ
jgi:hypothetical protein